MEEFTDTDEFTPAVSPAESTASSPVQPTSGLSYESTPGSPLQSTYSSPRPQSTFSTPPPSAPDSPQLPHIPSPQSPSDSQTQPSPSSESGETLDFPTGLPLRSLDPLSPHTPQTRRVRNTSGQQTASAPALQTPVETTPLKYTQGGTRGHTTEPTHKAKTLYQYLGKEMMKHFIGPMPPQDFLDTFFPSVADCLPPDLHPNENWVAPETSEINEDGSLFLTTICNSLNSCEISPGMKFVVTSKTPLLMSGNVQASRLPSQKIDLCCFPEGIETPDFKALDSWIELKKEEEDPFKHIPKLDKEHPLVKEFIAKAKAKAADAFYRGIREPDSEDKSCPIRGVAGQNTSYAQRHFENQPRTASFSVLILQNFVRLLRWDHGGCVVTERFDLRSRILADFIWRFNRSLPSEKGEDSSVKEGIDKKLATEARRAFAKLASNLPYKLKKNEKLRKVTIWDEMKKDANGKPTKRTFIATLPRDMSTSLIGRWTMGYLAYDPKNKRVVWIKDSWRINAPEFDKEGKIYAKLRDAGITNVMDVDCAGDVLHADGTPQSTRTHEFNNAGWSYNQALEPLPYIHYRIAFRTIGTPLNKFSSTYQLCSVLRDALETHKTAYEKAKIFHRDISAGNVMIVNGVGYLIDWDLSMKVESTRVPRRKWRTGTWQFMSIALLEDPEKHNQELCDDLESFFWLLMYMVFRYRYLPRLESKTVIAQKCMDDIFNQRTLGEVITGGKGKRAFLKDSVYYSDDRDIDAMADDGGGSAPDPLKGLVASLRHIFSNLYTNREKLKPTHKNLREDAAQYTGGSVNLPNATPKTNLTITFDMVIDFFTKALLRPGWYEDDNAVDGCPESGQAQTPTPAANPVDTQLTLLNTPVSGPPPAEPTLKADTQVRSKRSRNDDDDDGGLEGVAGREKRQARSVS